jgi:catechol 2,3-dioxygenase-like lactoylglutathione lyase family enzyme
MRDRTDAAHGAPGVNLAKPHVDVGLHTNQLEPMLEFWQQEVGLPFEEMLPVGGGSRQHRHGMNGSVLKINHARDPLPEGEPSGYRELFIARDGIAEHRRLVDPDGNIVTLVPRSEGWCDGIAVRLAVRYSPAFHHFYGAALGLEPAGSHAYRCGDSILLFDEVPDTRPTGDIHGKGYRYLTVQVWDCDTEYQGILARGGAAGRAPLTLGATARFGFVRDPDGNWIEISQRASLTGPLPP